MIAFSQSALLQALGWATLNSFWQVGVLWCGFVLACRFGSISADRQFRLAVSGIGISLVSFMVSFWFYLQPGTSQIFDPLLWGAKGQTWLPAVLTAASMAYLLLLLVPAAKLFQNWRFLRKLRRGQLSKAPVQYRLFVRKVGGHLGLRRPVQVFLSGLVSSPVTIGYFKPLILLPIASFNGLSTRQAEAILLHELAHIRRFDFVVNIAITVAQTVLYFNPFVRLFVQAAETSRERSCDEMVLQFDYDPVAYASALLQLEKSKQPQVALALAAAGRSPLFHRIQAILGLQHARPTLKMQHLTGLLASLLCIFALHSLFIAGKNSPENDVLQTVARLANPLQIALSDYEDPAPKTDDGTNGRTVKLVTHTETRIVEATTVSEVTDRTEMVAPPPPPPLPEDALIQVSQAEVAIPVLSAEEQKKIDEVISTTKKVLSAYEWNKLEQEIADGLTHAEKSRVQEQYATEMGKINWERMQQNLAQNFHQTDLEKVQLYIKSAEAMVKHDSLIHVYSSMLSQIEGAHKPSVSLPLPDLSIKELENIQAYVRQVRDSLISAQRRPVIKL